MVRLLNIRLSKQDAAVVKQLRRKGVVVSDLVRVALHNEHARQHANPEASPADILESLHQKYPPKTARKRKRIDTTDRKQVAAHIRSRLKNRAKRTRP